MINTCQFVIFFPHPKAELPDCLAIYSQNIPKYTKKSEIWQKNSLNFINLAENSPKHWQIGIGKVAKNRSIFGGEK